MKKRLAGKEIGLELSEEVFVHLAKDGYSPQYGARPLKRLIQNKILSPVATMMISRKVEKGSTVQVNVKDGQFTFEVKRPRVKSEFVKSPQEILS